jgi:hypothetical protein
MGYTTYFSGDLEVSPTLAPEHREYLLAFSRTRRMARDPQVAAALPDPCRVASGLPLGEQAAYFVGGEGSFGQGSDPSIVSYNDPPADQPGLWCQWVPTDDGAHIEWDGGEKFYEYTAWLRYLVDNFFGPWEYEISGEVFWEGEDSDDRGIIRATRNTIDELLAPSLESSIRNAEALNTIAQLLDGTGDPVADTSAITAPARELS